MVRVFSPERHQRYYLTGGDCYQVESPCGKNNFVRPVTLPAPRVYTVSLPGRFLYVGTTTQTIWRRLYGGRKDLYCHMFKKLSERMALDIWTFSIKDEGNPSQVLKAIEAEVAFCCRAKDNWPELQQEIHFQPSSEEHRRIGKIIYEHAMNPSAPLEFDISAVLGC